MSYAVRKDLLGWRAISSKEEVEYFEFYSELAPSIDASDTLEQNLLDLNNKFESDLDKICKKYIVSCMSGDKTLQEEIKKLYLDMKKKHDTDVQNVNKKYQ